MKNEGIIYNDVKKIANPPTEQEIISRLCGGDLTDGSCSSLAFAYAGNKGGYDVLDFRGGNSCNQFSDNDNINRIVTICGGMVESNGIGYDNAIANLNRVQKGKEYYFGAGLHSAVIRRNDKGQIEYLELQAPKEKNNKWQKLTDKKLYSRFGCDDKEKDPSQLVEIDMLNENKGFRRLLGYINTPENEQMKGKRGKMR